VSTIRVIGVGNLFRGDDAAGRIVARELASRIPSDASVSITESSGEAGELMESFDGVDCVLLADAIEANAEPGRVFRFDASDTPLPAPEFACSTHALGLSESIELARALERLPSVVIVYGIQGESFEHGKEISPAVRRGIAETMERILGDIGIL